MADENSERIRVDEGFVDSLGIDELADRIVRERYRRSGARPSPGMYPPSNGASADHGFVSADSSPVPRAAIQRDVTPPPVPEPRRPNGQQTQPDYGQQTQPDLLSALDGGGTDDLESLVDAIVSGNAGAPPRLPGDVSHPGFDDGDDQFQIERNEAPFPVFRTEAPRGEMLDDVIIEPPLTAPPVPSSSSPGTPSSSSPSATPMPSSSSSPGAQPEMPHQMTGPMLAQGDMVTDRYRIVGLLGEGGVSVVYRAEHMLLMKHVALKLMRPELSSMPTARERFALEARSVCQLDHPNIVRVTDFGYANDGRMFLVMDLIEGESLGAVMDRFERLEPAMALTITMQLLRGLRHAHERGVVHRDLKPDNIVITTRDGDQQPKILDFGIAKITDQQQGKRSITQAGTVFGTPRYMSPEQAAGEPIDLRTDIYTMGVIMYQLLTGRLPFDGTSTVQILSRVLTQPPPAMALNTPTREVGRALEALVLKGLEKERENRYGSATEMLMTIEAVARQRRLFG
nr:serine/threonine-protein kinase pkn3-like [Nerophis lumbriciformis]